ncbi:hypothetical protein SISSUDRAFT_1060113 [Sistotremastrum suecicum HHB10207 ss-3]|uniref:Uncharacterized protein n=1 Tax=Sistotremastrum suecicum HHB10207 ss-3 TaxID=1314776 RepID=A0A166FGW4_9AGAM|nr:hypothetical protein SISSUDRAFT_1060113 [Sistotremastrum suecicum HHB10207 ss-3]
MSTTVLASEIPDSSPSTVAGTPTKSPARTPATPIVRQDDESKWRKSRIKPTKTINRTKAMALYRLHVEELPNSYDIDYKPVSFARVTEAKTYLYLEVDVERAAWKKHGGPEAFETYMNNLRTRHEETRKTKFQQPLSYRPKRAKAASATNRAPASKPATFIQRLEAIR